MIKTPRIDSMQSIKDKSGSVLIIRRSQLDASIYRMLVKQKLVPSKTPEVSIDHVNEKEDMAIQTSFLPKEKPSAFIMNLRWVISFCDCMMQISKFFCMDSAQALQTYFQAGELNLSGTQYNLFYSIFAYLFILPFLSGYISDKLGVRVGLITFCLIQTIGHIIFMIGGTSESFVIMLIGRFLFGVGALCVEVCEDVLITIWFFDKELTMALGLSFASCRVGTALTSIITPQMMEISGNYFLPLFVGTIFSLVGLGCCIIMIMIDRKYQKIVKHELVDSFIQENSIVQHEMNFSDIFKLGKMFWLIVLNCLFAYTCYFSFVDNGNDILVTLYNFTPQKAGYWLTIIYMISAFCTPIFGILIDKLGRRVMLMYISLIALIVPHLIFAFMSVDSHKGWVILSLGMIGFFYAIYAAVFWSCIPLVVDNTKQGIAFGTVYSTLNVVLVIASLFIGIIHDNTEQFRGGYQFCVIFMVCSLVLAVYTTQLINKLDKEKGGALNSVVTNTEIRNKMNQENDENNNILELLEEKKKEYLEMEELNKKN